jgi:putative transposase
VGTGVRSRPEGVIHDVQHDCLILHRTTVQLEGRLAAVLAHSDPLAFLHHWEGIVTLSRLPNTAGMKTPKFLYQRHRFPPVIIQYAVWLYYRFSLSFRDVEDLLAERGVTVSYETVRRWCTKFGPRYATRLRRRYGRYGDTWHVDEVFVRIRGKQKYLYRAVDQDGDVIDILVQENRNTSAAVRFFRRLVKRQGVGPRRLVTDKLKSYPAARLQVMPGTIHITDRYTNNRAEVSHESPDNENDSCDALSP